MEILQWLLRTDSGVVGRILRITLAVVIFPHGAQKALGWFGGHGLKGIMKYFTDAGIPTAGDRRRVSWFARPCGRALDARCRLWHRVRDARSYYHGSLGERFLYELVR
jgi:hypothetical protein